MPGSGVRACDIPGHSQGEDLLDKVGPREGMASNTCLDC